MVFAPFLECCGDAVMFAKQNAILDDEDDGIAMTIVFLVMKCCGGGYEMSLFWMLLECFRLFSNFMSV